MYNSISLFLRRISNCCRSNVFPGQLRDTISPRLVGYSLCVFEKARIAIIAAYDISDETESFLQRMVSMRTPDFLYSRISCISFLSQTIPS